MSELFDARDRRLAAAHSEGQEVAKAVLTRPSHFDGTYWLKADLPFEISRCPHTGDVLVRIIGGAQVASPSSTELAIAAGMLRARAPAAGQCGGSC